MVAFRKAAAIILQKGFLMALSDADQKAMFDRIMNSAYRRLPDDKTVARFLDQNDGSSIVGRVVEAAQKADAAGAKAAAAESAAKAAGVKVDNLAASIQDIVATAAAEAVHGYLMAHPPTVTVDVAALAKAVNDDADARARDDNPSTGPRS